MTEPPPPSTEPPSLLPSTTVIHPRREPFEHGLLPIPKLIFSDPTQTLISFKHKLLQSSSNNRVDSAAVSDSLQISVEQARLVLDTIASILPYDSESDTVDIHDLVLFLYIQSYKRLLPRTHKDSAAVADVSALSPASGQFFNFVLRSFLCTFIRCYGIMHCLIRVIID
jgi:TBCC domain-containing protein 1